MLDLQKRINAFISLGDFLRTYHDKSNKSVEAREFDELVSDLSHFNGWFTEDMVRYMLASIGNSLHQWNIEAWLLPYRDMINNERPVKEIGVVMAGNIPVVGFHDFLSVLMSGNKIKAKLSSDDNKLIPALSDVLIRIEPGFSDRISFVNGQLKDFDAIVATGSNNTSRYFDYYFGKYPHIIRKNRNGVAVLNGSETEADLKALADDIFMFYGLGCRNVSKLFVPEDFNFEKLLDVLAARTKIAENHKYFNNYEYNKAIYLVNGTAHFDSGNLMLVENDQFASPVSVVYYSTYKDVNDLKTILESNDESIQCIVSKSTKIRNVVRLGDSQQPQLWDYADNVDTMKFLLELT